MLTSSLAVDMKKRINIRIIGKAGIDAGGLQRTILQQVLQYVLDNTYFELKSGYLHLKSMAQIQSETKEDYNGLTTI